MNIKELQSLTVKQLQTKATKLGISEYIGLKKQELIKLILDFQVREKIVINGQNFTGSSRSGHFKSKSINDQR